MYSNNYFTKMRPNLTQILANDMNYSPITTPELQEFAEGTKNAAIFKLSAPYDNPYQGSDPRWLFVCSAGLLRSPTGAAEAVKRGINARSCGSNFSYALVPISANLVAWASKIVFVNKENYENTLDNFVGLDRLVNAVEQKAIVLNIPDCFEYGSKRLVEHFDEQLFKPYGPVTE
jgi:predicted protein tyrosine phosphatase